MRPNRYRVWLEGGTVHYDDRVDGKLEIPMSGVRLVGESTDQSGPYVDDWFLCLVDPECWYEISCYADGFKEFLLALSTFLGEELELKLYNSADFNSRILWPSSVRDEPALRVSVSVVGLAGRAELFAGNSASVQ